MPVWDSEPILPVFYFRTQGYAPITKVGVVWRPGLSSPQIDVVLSIKGAAPPLGRHLRCHH